MMRKNEINFGIDILEFSEFPKYFDSAEKQFFKDNFSENEIHYCLAQEDPTKIFACLFSIKESLIKADNSLLNTNFNKIELNPSDCGFNYKDYQALFSLNTEFCITFVISL